MSQPLWWTDSMATDWARARKTVMGSWTRVVGVPKITDPAVAEAAMELGFHCRTAFQDEVSWEGDLEKLLRLEWAAMRPEPWEEVSGAVRHGWESNPAGSLPPLSPTERDLAKPGPDS